MLVVLSFPTRRSSDLSFDVGDFSSDLCRFDEEETKIKRQGPLAGERKTWSPAPAGWGRGPRFSFACQGPLPLDLRFFFIESTQIATKISNVEAQIGRASCREREYN